MCGIKGYKTFPVVFTTHTHIKNVYVDVILKGKNKD
jgi:hypothetical protein